MAIRSGHGTGAGVPRVEVLPADELPEGLPADARPVSPTDRGERGHFARGNSLAVIGGRSRAGKTRLADRLGLSDLPEGSAFAPYRASAVSFRRAQCAALAASVGGGYCGPAPSSMIASASLQLAWSRYFSDLAAMDPDVRRARSGTSPGGDGKKSFAARSMSGAELALASSRLADASRQNLLAAHELCATEALARLKAPGALRPGWRYVDVPDEEGK